MPPLLLPTIILPTGEDNAGPPDYYFRVKVNVALSSIPITYSEKQPSCLKNPDRKLISTSLPRKKTRFR